MDQNNKKSNNRQQCDFFEKLLGNATHKTDELKNAINATNSMADMKELKSKYWKALYHQKLISDCSQLCYTIAYFQTVHKFPQFESVINTLIHVMKLSDNDKREALRYCKWDIHLTLNRHDGRRDYPKIKPTQHGFLDKLLKEANNKVEQIEDYMKENDVYIGGKYIEALYYQTLIKDCVQLCYSIAFRQTLHCFTEYELESVWISLFEIMKLSDKNQRDAYDDCKAMGLLLLKAKKKQVLRAHIMKRMKNPKKQDISNKLNISTQKKRKNQHSGKVIGHATH